MGTWNGYLFHHGPRVSCIALRTGQSFGLSDEDQAALFFGSVLSDVGMIGMVEDAWENPKPSLSQEARAEVNEFSISVLSLRQGPWVVSQLAMRW